MTETTQIIRADQVMCGDLIDLGELPDPYVSQDDREHLYAYELARVIDYERETADCIRIDFDSTSIGFPLDFKLTLIDR